jgi:hypothetical protein
LPIKLHFLLPLKAQTPFRCSSHTLHMRFLQRTIPGSTRAPRVLVGAPPTSPVSLNNQKHQYIWIQQSKSARFFGPQFLCSSDGQPPAQKLWRAR